MFIKVISVSILYKLMESKKNYAFHVQMTRPTLTLLRKLIYEQTNKSSTFHLSENKYLYFTSEVELREPVHPLASELNVLSKSR